MDRPDGRSASTLRPLSCELSTLQNADGSSLWKSGSTHVLAAVHGPMAPRQPHHELEYATVSVVIKSGTAINTLEREWEDFLTQVLSACILVESYPRSIVQVVVQVLAADGSVLVACLHACVSALMDAGIVMKTLPVGVTCLLAADETIQLDPSAQEEQAEGAGVIVLVSESNNLDMILGCHTQGIQNTMDKILQCSSVAERAAPAVTAFWRLAIEQKVTRESKTLWSS